MDLSFNVFVFHSPLLGFLPQMELQSKMPSALVNEERMDAASSSAQFQDNIKWDKHISFEEAYSALESQFYDFKKVRDLRACTNRFSYIVQTIIFICLFSGNYTWSSYVFRCLQFHYHIMEQRIFFVVLGIWNL